MREKAEGLLYQGLFVLLLFSFVLLGIKVMGVGEAIWLWYYKLYLFLAIIHIWYIFILLFIVDGNGTPGKPYENERIAVIVPVFNEDPVLVDRTVRSILRAKGR